jgi:NAD(P)H-hydrate repair Nnr-like enzyme with NAD(P)H-hydrate epimerase domain
MGPILHKRGQRPHRARRFALLGGSIPARHEWRIAIKIVNNANKPTNTIDTPATWASVNGRVLDPKKSISIARNPRKLLAKMLQRTARLDNNINGKYLLG